MLAKTVVLCCTVLLLSAVSAAAAGQDELWEMSVEMKMQSMGMQMPPTKTTVCLPKNGTYDPKKDQTDKNCKVTKLKVVGNKTTWEVQCSGETEMTGNGEMTKTANTMSGKTHLVSRDKGQPMEMTMIQSGRRIGTCDAKEDKKKIDALVQASQHDVCKNMVETEANYGGMEARIPEQFTAKGQCAGSKKSLCEKARARVNSYAGYRIYAQAKGWVAGECGINLESVRTNLCSKAVNGKKYDFLKQACPEEVKNLTEKYCQGFGRGYTADAANPHAGLCRALTSTTSSGDEEAAPSAADSSGSSASDGANAPSSDSTAGKIIDGAKAVRKWLPF